MFRCPVCPHLVSVYSYENIRKHLNNHTHYGELSYPILCEQTDDCRIHVANTFNFMRHLQRHDFIFPDCSEDNRVNFDTSMDNLETSDSENFAGIVEENGDSIDIDSFVPINNKDRVNILKETLSTDIFEMLLSLRAKKTVPYTTSLEIVKLVERIVNKILLGVVGLVQQSFCDITDPALIRPTLSTIANDLETVIDIFSTFRSEHKIQKLYENHQLFVAPKSVPVGNRVEYERTLSGTKIRETVDTAQVVSITETTKAMLKLERFCEAVFENKSVKTKPGIYSRFQDGTRFQTFPPAAISVCAKPILILYIQLYSDGLGTTNPISQAAGKHNCTVYYMLFLDVHPKYYACLANIHLVACSNSVVIAEKKGQDAFLQVIVDELRELETVGFEANLPNRGTFQVYVRLGQFTADNLAINQNFGLIESFNSDYCCALCYSSKEERQIGFTKNISTVELKKNTMLTSLSFKQKTNGHCMYEELNMTPYLTSCAFFM